MILISVVMRNFWDLTLKKDVVLHRDGNRYNLGVRKSVSNIKEKDILTKAISMYLSGQRKNHQKMAGSEKLSL